MLKTIFPSFILISLLSLTTTCSSPTEPGKDSGPDTTSQNFIFETFEFGDGSASSYLNDVWIFDENNIWAVGDISKTDSLPLTNIIVWNGKKWTARTEFYTSSGVNGIWAFDKNLIYFASGGIRFLKNGVLNSVTKYDGTFGSGQGVHKLWGSSATNIWGVVAE